MNEMEILRESEEKSNAQIERESRERKCHYKKSAHNWPIKPTDDNGRNKGDITDRLSDQHTIGRKDGVIYDRCYRPTDIGRLCVSWDPFSRFSQLTWTLRQREDITDRPVSVGFKPEASQWSLDFRLLTKSFPTDRSHFRPPSMFFRVVASWLAEGMSCGAAETFPTALSLNGGRKWSC